MSEALHEVLAANTTYAENFGDRAALQARPKRGIAVLTCMDARLNPAQFAGLGDGDAHVIRNAGGRASDDAIRSLVISHRLMGTREWFVIHHTDCGMMTITNEAMNDLLDQDGLRVDDTPIDWLPIADPIQSLLADVERIRSHPLVPNNVRVYGYFFDVKSGRLLDVEQMAEENGLTKCK